ncbi:MAG: EAL domain-containing protein [Desulfobacteraceae bacterium]|nr:EAL domain-containing protein [Desulfobacteraceae bacterium]
MIFNTPAIRLSTALVLLTINLLLLAELIGFVPDKSKSALKVRKSLSESLALQFCTAAEKGEFQTIQATLRAVVDRNDDIRSAAIRTNDGKLLAIEGEHLLHWKPPADGKSTPTHVKVPLFLKNKKWAEVEICFAPLWANTRTNGITNSFTGLLIFIGVGCFICYFFLIKRTLRELDPAAVIPERVQKAFDVLQEGVVILDEKELIVMTNKAFAGLLGKAPKAMIGLKGSELGWLECHTPEQVGQLPWFKAMEDGKEQKGVSLRLRNSLGNKIKLAVNASILTDNGGKRHGTLVTFDDITQLEEKNLELSDLVDKLQVANDDINGKNRELEILASCDPMTLCLNRRSLGKRFDVLFTRAKANGEPLCCLMADIDFFKKVNDNYGHATGDEVIKAVADVLKTATRDTDLVGRYGGEEFCVVLPQINTDQAVRIAERIRRTIEKKSCSGVKVTVSQGVSSIEFNAGKPDELIDQADKALYAAKKGGRNQVITWGEDLESLSEADAGEEIREQVSKAEAPKPEDTDQAKLERRVLELEGLLEKRTLELEHFKMYDFKTGLPTRSLFEDRLTREIARSKRMNTQMAVLSMTIDTIKRVHETLGYKAAEQLVKACGQRLNAVLRGNIDTVAVIENAKDMSSVSLITQTEFGILLIDIRQVDHVTWIMKRMLDAFKKPVRIKENEIYASVYFGVSIFPHDGKTGEALYSSATNACRYARKLNGKERYLFSSQNLNEMAANKLQIENLLHDAIRNDELQLHYQPKIEAATGLIGGFEALLRWRNARLGFVPPDHFIPVAEQSGLIDELGDWVLYTACQQLRIWMDMGLVVAPIAVNMSGIQLGQQTLANRIQHILDEFKIDVGLLEIELTESSLINSRDKSFAVLKKIREMGLRVTMDDFGTGYSSLSYLRDIPLSGLKIDKSFVADIDKDENANKLIISLVSIAHVLGLEVVAEGVEEKHQADHLTALGCEYLQGYYFSRPIPGIEVVKILKEQQTRLTS